MQTVEKTKKPTKGHPARLSFYFFFKNGRKSNFPRSFEAVTNIFYLSCLLVFFFFSYTINSYLPSKWSDCMSVRQIFIAHRIKREKIFDFEKKNIKFGIISMSQFCLKISIRNVLCLYWFLIIGRRLTVLTVLLHSDKSSFVIIFQIHCYFLSEDFIWIPIVRGVRERECVCVYMFVDICVFSF